MAFFVDPHELHRYSLDEYHRLIESGAFDGDDHVELLEGLLLSLSPKTREHERALRFLNLWLTRALDPKTYEVGVGAPLTISASEPEPDIVVFPQDAPQPYHPGWALLVIEIAVSSHRRDLGPKHAIYAKAGIPHYWVVDVLGRRFACHAEPAGERYSEQQIATEGDLFAPDELAVPPLDISALFAAATA